jgi:hypothetical protein
VHVEALDRLRFRGNDAAAIRPRLQPLAGALRKARAPAACAVGALALITATCAPRETQPIDVSVRDVVIDPYAVDGKLVRLTGRLHRGPQGDALYWHERDVQQSLRSHAVAVDLRSAWPEGADRPGTYVAVEGIFEADADGASAKYNGALLEAREAQLR